MATMLRHKVTGEVWAYNVDLARHDDVESFVQVDPQFSSPAPVPAPENPVSKRKKKEPAPAVKMSFSDDLEGLDDLLADD